MPRSLSASPTPSGNSIGPISQNSTSGYTNSAACANNNNRAWTPPLWLMSGADQKHAARVAGNKSSQAQPIFRLDVPAVAPETFRAVAKQINECKLQQQPFAVEQQQVLHLQNKLKEQRRKVRELKKGLKEMEQRKEQGLKDIRTLRGEEMAKAQMELERKMRLEYQEQAKERKLQWKKKVQEECENKRKRLREEDEAKRKKEKEQEHEAKRRKEDENEEQQSGEVDEKADELSESKVCESAVLQKQVDELQKEVETLNENRLEMIWLLKKVIVADQKRKAKNAADKKAEPKADTPKET